MGVVMKGGTSGNREDALPPVPNRGTPQPLLRTETFAPHPSTVVFNTTHGHIRHTEGERMDDDIANDMPTGGTFPESGNDEDVCQCDIENLGPTSGNHGVFKGAPNTGTKGGPA